MNSSQFLSISDCAKKLGFSEVALRKNLHRKSKNVPPFHKIGKVYLFIESEVDAWLSTLPQVYLHQHTTEVIYRVYDSKNKFKYLEIKKGRPKDNT